MEVPVRVLFVTRALLPPPVGGLESGGERCRRVQRGRRWEERGGNAALHSAALLLCHLRERNRLVRDGSREFILDYLLREKKYCSLS